MGTASNWSVAVCLVVLLNCCAGRSCRLADWPVLNHSAPIRPLPPCDHKGTTILSTLFGLSESSFFSNVWEQRPLYSHAGATIQGLVLPSEVGAIVDAMGAKVRNGGQKTKQKARYAIHGAQLPGRLVKGSEDMEEMYTQGHSTILSAMEELHTAVHKLTSDMEEALKPLTVQANMYHSPPHSAAFPLHFDDDDVIVLQLYGSKRWMVYEQGLDHPLLPIGVPSTGCKASSHKHARVWDSLIARYANESSVHVQMSPGDVLYLPRGTPHDVTSLDEASLHLTMTVIGWEHALWGQYINTLLEVMKQTPALLRILRNQDPDSADGAAFEERLDECKASVQEASAEPEAKPLRQFAAPFPYIRHLPIAEAHEAWGQALGAWEAHTMSSKGGSGSRGAQFCIRYLRSLAGGGISAITSNIGGITDTTPSTGTSSSAAIASLMGLQDTPGPWTRGLTLRLLSDPAMAPPTQFSLAREQQDIFFTSHRTRAPPLPGGAGPGCSLHHPLTRVRLTGHQTLYARVPELLPLMSQADFEEIKDHQRRGTQCPDFLLLRGLRGKYLKIGAADALTVDQIMKEHSAAAVLEDHSMPRAVTHVLQTAANAALFQDLHNAGVIALECGSGRGGCELALECMMASYYVLSPHAQ